MKKILLCTPLLLLFLPGMLAQNKTAKTTVKRTIPSAQKSIVAGKAVYTKYCLTCHQADGGGVPNMNPPLEKTEYVLGDKNRLINIILRGLDKEIEINGDTYVNPMPSHDFLKDKEVADVLTYIRNSFGNKASAVTAAEVKKARLNSKPNPNTH